MASILEVDGDRAESIGRELPERFEEIDGQIVEMPPMSDLANVVANRLHLAIGAHVTKAKFGQAFMESLFKLPEPVNRNRRPDVSFVSFERWPADKPFSTVNARPVVPDLAIEVISPSDLAEGNHEKLVEYFRVGVRQVWVVIPQLRLFYVYDSVTQVRGFTDADVIDGGTVIPGLKLVISELLPRLASE